MAERHLTESLHQVALQAQRDLHFYADEIRTLVSESLPRNAPKALTNHLNAVAERLDETARLLARELDRPYPSSRFIRGLASLGKVAIVGLAALTGAVATGAAEGVSSAVVSHRLGEIEAALESRLDQVESLSGETQSVRLIELTGGQQFTVTGPVIVGSGPGLSGITIDGPTVAAEQFRLEPARDQVGVIVQALQEGDGVRLQLEREGRPFIIHPGGRHVVPDGARLLVGNKVLLVVAPTEATD